MISYKFFDRLPSEAVNIRKNVFVDEQGFHNEFDDIDKKAVHLIIYLDGEAVGNVRAFPSETSFVYVIGRLAVLKNYRRFHLGEKLMLRIENKIRELGGRKCVLSAQCRVKKFYEKLGYTADGNIYFDEHCPHIRMEKSLL